MTLAPGSYTAIISGKNGTTGTGLVEAYDLDSSSTNSRFYNISTRGQVLTGDMVMIGGFILGRNNANANVILRGKGPSLTAFGVSGALADPTIELHDGDGALIRANNDWQDDPSQAGIISASGLAPTDPKESAIAASLAPGNYTVILAGRNGGTGVGLVEVFVP